MICDHRALIDAIDAARRAGWIALDTEFLRERTYAPQLCLIQATWGRDQHAVCIDTLAVEDLSPLGALIADADVLKVFHSPRQDLEALDTRTPMNAANLYDTQLAAAFCGYGDQVSYAALVETLCAVHLPKAHTRADWSRRPLPEAHLRYALDDVHYLDPLRQTLATELARRGRCAWHAEECVRASAPSAWRSAPQDAWRRLRGISRLDPVGQACVKALAAWREERAQAHNLPRGWVLSNPAVLQICRRRPSTPAQLTKIADLSATTRQRAGKEIIDLIARAARADNAHQTIPEEQALTLEQQNQAKEIMNLLARRAQQVEISQSLIANRQEVENLVRGQTDLLLCKGWRAQLVGDEISARYT